MTGILRPDGSEGSFKYDPLGRRIEKRASEQTTKFVWDGNNPIHEWVENGETESDKRNDLVTWIFDDGFVPTAKLTKDGNYSIISDYIGTPVEAYDLSGKKVWEQELDIYGRVKRSAKPSRAQKAEAALFDEYFIPFRYQGQYDDIETGLYYNRFRYYDPDIGQYTQPDPIGLEGGNPTLYSYVSNPNWWVDPLGLERAVSGTNIIGTNHNAIRPTQDWINMNQVNHYATRFRMGQPVNAIDAIRVPGRGVYILDGHHRYVASNITGIPLRINIRNSAGPIGWPDWSSVVPY